MMQTTLPTPQDKAAHCPRCGSTSITVVKKGYSAPKGCCGYLACGPLGFLCGQTGANELDKVCLNCDHKWR